MLKERISMSYMNGLLKKSINGILDSEVKWNFNKYLISEEGMLIAYFASTTSPMSNDITKFLD